MDKTFMDGILSAIKQQRCVERKMPRKLKKALKNCTIEEQVTATGPNGEEAHVADVKFPKGKWGKKAALIIVHDFDIVIENLKIMMAKQQMEQANNEL